MGRLEGKVAMVTGSGGERGFGRAIARRLAAEGADLVLTDLAPAGHPRRAHEARDRLARARGRRRGDPRGRPPGRHRPGRRARGRSDPARRRPRRPDLRPDRHPRQQRRRSARRRPRPRGRASGGGVARDPGDQPHRHVSLQPGRRRAMVARGIRGRIINMSSNCGKVGYARLAAYCASKFGVIGFTQALALELAPHRITVNAICPGSADTDRLDFLGRRPDGSYDQELRAGGHRRAVRPDPASARGHRRGRGGAGRVPRLGRRRLRHRAGDQPGRRRHHALRARPRGGRERTGRRASSASRRPSRRRGESRAQGRRGARPCRRRCSRCRRRRSGPRSGR